MLVQEFLECSAERLPDKTALILDGGRFTYREIDSAANRFANALIGLGIRRCDRVVLYLPNSLELVVAIFGTLKAGGIFVVVNPSTRYPKLAYLLNDCQASALVTGASHAQALPGIIDQVSPHPQVILCGASREQNLEKEFVLFESIQAHASSLRPTCVSIDLDLACLIYTSGSTGEPKGVMSDHSNVDFVSAAIIQYLHNREEDIVLNCLPLSFDYGLYQLFMVFRFGGTLMLEKGFLYPSALIKRIQEEKVSGFPGVPTIFAVLLQMDLDKFQLGSLRYLTNTAAAMPLSMIEKLRSRFPEALLYSMYGLTETKRTLYLPPEQLALRPGSVGIPIPGTEVWLEDEDGCRLGDDEVGELVIRGRHVMRGYWNAPELSSLRFRPGPIPGERVCYSGDLFRRDREGFYTFVARKDDVLKCRGEKVAPVEVERAVNDLEGVLECAVIGVPDPLEGQAVKVFVVSSRTDLDAPAVLRHCRARLEDFMIPKYVEFRSSLPKTSSGKIDKKGLG